MRQIGRTMYANTGAIKVLSTRAQEGIRSQKRLIFNAMKKSKSSESETNIEEEIKAKFELQMGS